MFSDATSVNRLSLHLANCHSNWLHHNTEYSEVEVQKCEDFYWKQCKIVFKERTFDATSRVCKRALIKDCSGGGRSKPQSYGANSLNGAALIGTDVWNENMYQCCTR